MSHIRNMRSETGYQYSTGKLNTPNNFGAQFAQQSSQYSVKPFGLPVPPGADKYANHPLASWLPFFGANPKVYEKPAEYEYQRDVLNMPEGFKGQCEHIDRMLINQISNADMWPIREAMPWKSNNDALQITWNEITFNDHLLSRTPEQSVSRLLTQKYDSHTDTMQRYGIAMLLEHGFMRTSKGVANYLANIQQIKNATLETLMLGAQESLLYIDRAGWLSSKQGGVRSKTDLIKAEQRDIRFWGIAQKQGFAICLDDMKDEYQRVNGSAANYLIVGQGVLKYVATSGDGEGVFRMGQTTRVPQSKRINGLTVREWRPARIGDGRKDLDVSKINAVIGGFVPLRMNHLKNIPPEEWQTQFMNVRTHDEEADDYFVIDYKECHKLCGLFAPNQRTSRGMDGFGGPYLKDSLTPEASEPRWMLTRSGHEFFEGCSSWGEYMQEHGLMNNWVTSFLIKNQIKQARFLADIAKRPLPGPKVGFTGTAQIGNLLYSDPDTVKEISELMDKQAVAVGRDPADIVAEAKRGGRGEHKQDGKSGDATDTTVADLWRAEIKAAAEQKNALNPNKIFSRILGAVIKAEAPRNEGFVELDKTLGRMPSPSDESEAVRTVQRALNALYADDGSTTRVTVALLRPHNGADKGGLFNITYNSQRVFPIEGTGTAVTLATTLLSPNKTDLEKKKAINDAKATLTITKLPPAQLLFTGLQTALRTIVNLKSEVDDANTVIADTVYALLTTSDAWTFAGRLDSIERRRLARGPADDLRDQISVRDLPMLPRDVFAALQRPSNAMDLKDDDADDPWLDRHKDTVRAIYSRRGPGAQQSAFAFKSKRDFIAVIKAVRDAPTSKFEEDDAELATTLFLSELYNGALESIPEKLESVMRDQARLQDEVRGGMARLLLMYKDVGHQMVRILGTMMEDSLKTLAEHRRSERDEGPLTDQRGRLANMREEDLDPNNAGRFKPKGRFNKDARIKMQAAALDSSAGPGLEPSDVEELLYSIPITNPDLVFWGLENDCWPLLFFNTFAPSMEYVTSAMVLMGAYGESGFTYHGQHSFELGDDATIKVHYGHFTLYFKSIVENTRKVVVRNNTFVHEYVGGNDATFWNSQDPQDRQDWQSGLHTKSRLVQAYYPDDVEANNSWRLNITGYEHPDVRGPSDKPVPSTAPITARMWQFRHPINPNVQKPYIEAMNDYQTVCYQSHFQGCRYIGKGQFDPWGESFLDKGHWGPDNGYPGCGGVRNGKRMWFERPNFSALSMRTNVIATGSAAGSS